MSISLLLSPPLRTLLSYSCNLLLAFWGSALQTALGTKCCPCPCRQEGVTCAIPNLPTPLCVNNLLKPPFFGSKAVSFHTLCLFQLFVIYQVCLPGRKRRCVMGSCCLQGEKLFQLRQPCGLQDFSWSEMANFLGWAKYSRSHRSCSILF